MFGLVLGKGWLIMAISKREAELEAMFAAQAAMNGKIVVKVGGQGGFVLSGGGLGRRGINFQAYEGSILSAPGVLESIRDQIAKIIERCPNDGAHWKGPSKDDLCWDAADKKDFDAPDRSKWNK